MEFLKKIHLLTIMQDVRKKSPYYLDDLVKQGYYLVDWNDIYGKYSSSLRNTNSVPFRLIDESKYIADDLFCTKAMMAVPREVFGPEKQDLEFLLGNYTDPIKFSRDNFITTLKGIVFEHNNVFYGTFHKELQKLHEFGIINNMKGSWAKENEKLQVLRRYESKKQEVLSLKHLQAGLYLWIGACVISILAFIGEKFYYYANENFNVFLVV